MNKRVSAVAATIALLAVMLPFSARSADSVFPDNRETASSIRGALLAEAQSDDVETGHENDSRMEPWKVAMISAVLPGYGQVYNGSVWKVPILYGLLGYFGYKAIDYNDSYTEFRDKYSLDPNGPDARTYRDERDRYQEKRNQQLLFLVLSYLAGIVDAYVDAHLYDFDAISEEGISSASGYEESYPSVSVSLKF